ncbi:MAG: hypothetical protein AB7O62_09205 [Pirellulales bacterium]
MSRRLICKVLAVLAMATSTAWITRDFSSAIGTAWACPFCGGVQQTLSDEINTAEASVIVKLVGKVEKQAETVKAPAGGIPVPPQIEKTRFEIVEILKGAELVGDTKQIEVLYFGDAKPGTPFLIQGAELDGLAWGTPVVLTDRAVSYVRQLPELPESGGERLAFFQKYLEDEEQLMANDSYDEFAKAPYADVKAVVDYLDHDQLIAWIKNPETLTSHARLYYLMLGLVSQANPRPGDIKMLEEGITADPIDLKPALDAMIGCYLTLRGAEGMPLIEDTFLKNPKSPYADTYSAIMALRFHGQEEQIIPRERILVALRYLLDRPELADLIIPDLARWEDWSAMDRLVALFKNADDKSSWVRVPVIQFLKACPLPEAEVELQELAKIDPGAVRRASLFIPLGGTAPKPVPPAAKPAAGDNGEGEASEAPANAEKSEKPAAAEPVKGALRKKTRAQREGQASLTNTTRFAKTQGPAPSRALMTAPFAGGAVLLGLMMSILRTSQKS